MPAQQKFRYKVDPLNRLVITKPKSISSPLRKTYVVDGNFAIGLGNSLVWKARSREGTPLYRITFTGTWSITSGYDLEFTLDKSETQVFGDTLVLKAELEKPYAWGLNFTLRGGKTPTGVRKRLVRLRGHWQVDRWNRLSFMADSRRGTDPYEIVLGTTWEIGPYNRLVVRVKKGRPGHRTTKTIEFQGTWEFSQRGRLDYKLDALGRSAFRFTAALKKTILLAHDNKLPFEIRVQVARGRFIRKQLVLTGKWKVRRFLGLAFEIESGKRRYQALRFTTSFYLNKKSQLALKLKGRRGQDLGLEILFTHKFWQDAETFVRVRRELPEAAVEAGARVPF